MPLKYSDSTIITTDFSFQPRPKSFLYPRYVGMNYTVACRYVILHAKGEDCIIQSAAHHMMQLVLQISKHSSLKNLSGFHKENKTSWEYEQSATQFC